MARLFRVFPKPKPKRHFSGVGKVDLTEPPLGAGLGHPQGPLGPQWEPQGTLLGPHENPKLPLGVPEMLKGSHGGSLAPYGDPKEPLWEPQESHRGFLGAPWDPYGAS